MNRLPARPFTRGIALLLCLLLLPLHQLPGANGAGTDKSKLEGLFNWSKKYYLDGKYWETVRKLELLLTFVDEKDRQLLARVYLLLGAAREKMGKIVKARNYYKEAKKIIGDGQDIPKIEEIDFGSMVEYQRIIMGNTQPLMERVIEIESRRPKKKTVAPALVLGTMAVMAGVLMFLILKRKKASERSGFPTDTAYDTRELEIIWVRIPSGKFMMGDNFNEGEADEQPVHPVYLGIYYISKYEVTFDQYDRFCRDTGRNLPPDDGWGRGSRPVTNVSWYDANSFCTWLSQKTGKDIHLPTEAQWEKAARGADQRRYPWGNASPTCTFTNYGCLDRTEPVGLYPAGVSPYGVHDMAGNVAEWCKDAYASNYYNYSPYGDPQGPDLGIYVKSRVVRGGSWNSNSPLGLSTRSADRGQNHVTTDIQQKNIVYNDLGFRIVMEFN